MTQTLRIGILNCGHVHKDVVARNGDYVAWFRAMLEPEGLSLPAWSVVDMDFPPSIHAADGWLLTGSPLSAYEDHAFIAPLSDFIREIQATGMPMVGICFGHQMIAQALGGRVARSENGFRIGQQSYDIPELSAQVTLNAWHQDQVVAPPPGAETIGIGPGVPHAALRIGRTLTLQTHPEMTNNCLLDLIALRRDNGTLSADQIREAEAKAETPTDSARVATWIARHFHEALAT